MQSHRWLHSARVCSTWCGFVQIFNHPTSFFDCVIVVEVVVVMVVMNMLSATECAHRIQIQSPPGTRQRRIWDVMKSTHLTDWCLPSWISNAYALRWPYAYRISIYTRFTGPATRCALRIQLAISTLYLHQTSISKLRDLVFGSRHAAVHTSCLTVINIRLNQTAAYVSRSSSDRFTGIYLQLNTMYCVDCSIFGFWAFAICIFIELK